MEHTTCTVPCEDVTQGACGGAIRVFRLTLKDDHAVIGLCMDHAGQRGYLNAPRFATSDDEAAKSYLAAHPVCEDAGKKWNPHRPKAPCSPSSAPFISHDGNKAGLLVFYLAQTGEYVALCVAHAGGRGYWDHPRMLDENEGLREHALQQRILKADQEFVQAYHPELRCIQDRDDCAKNEVAEYFFSDGSEVPICTVHLPEIEPLRISHHGHWMSREYYDQVYTLRDQVYTLRIEHE